MKEVPNIPRIPHAFFKWYCKKDRYEELHGDLEEFYVERLEEMGPVKARLLYLRDVIRCCQPYAWKTPHVYSNSSIYMFKNYFKTSLRSMVRNPLSSFINVFGLSVAIGVCIVVYTMLSFTYSVDEFHENKETVHLVTFNADKDGALNRYGTTPAPLGEMLQQDFPQVTRMARIEGRSVVIKTADQVYHENLLFVEPDYLEMLTFPLKWGDKSSLSGISNIILSDKMAVKYFGRENPIGKEVTVKFSDSHKKAFTVAGVAETFPKAHAISFDFLVNYENLKTADQPYNNADWTEFVAGTLIQINENSDIVEMEAAMSKYADLHNAATTDWDIDSFDLEPLSTLRSNSVHITGDISTDIEDELTIGLPIMGLFMLALACFNYINMAIGSATKRLKEIGVRKVIGANRGRVITQFLAENIMLTFFALILGLLLTYTLFLPWFSEIAGSPLQLRMTDTDLWLFLIITLFTTGFISGVYPSLYISKFQVVKIFKGTVRFGKKNPLMKAFLAFQMILAFVFITMAVMFNQNSNFQASRPWGYNQEGALYVEVQGKQAYEQLAAAMNKNPNVIQVAGSNEHLGKSVTSVMADMAERAYQVDGMHVEPSYFETMGIELLEGKIFNKSEGGRQVLVNELFVKNAQIENPVGHMLKIDSVQHQIVGVVKDFHAFNFYYPMKAMVFQAAQSNDYQFLTMRVREGTDLDVYSDLKQEWAKLFPETPFIGGQQIDLWATFYDDLENMKRFTRTVAIVAILLAGLGLYGLVTLNVSGRVKEFSIRKILGAGIKNIGSSISRQYLLLSMLAFIVGAPISYFMNLELVKMMFAHPLTNAHWAVGGAFIILLSVMVGVIVTQVRRVIVSNPAVGLRSE